MIASESFCAAQPAGAVKTYSLSVARPTAPGAPPDALPAGPFPFGAFETAGGADAPFREARVSMALTAGRFLASRSGLVVSRPTATYVDPALALYQTMVSGGLFGICTSIFDQMKLPATPFCGDVPGRMMPDKFPMIVEWRWRTSCGVSSAGR